MNKLRELMVCSVMICFWACGSTEQALVQQFFIAVRSGDSATVAAMSAVGFTEAVESWEMLEVTSESTRPFNLAELRRMAETATKARDEQLEEGRNFQDDNYDSIERIKARLEKDSDHQFTGKLGEIHKEWSTLLQDRKAKERTLQDINREIKKEIQLSEKSLLGSPEIERLEGDVAVKELLVMVKTPESGEKPYTFILRKYNLTDQESNRTLPSRWVIADIKEEIPT
jgi:hypothetical protein